MQTVRRDEIVRQKDPALTEVDNNSPAAKCAKR